MYTAYAAIATNIADAIRTTRRWNSVDRNWLITAIAMIANNTEVLALEAKPREIRSIGETPSILR